MDTETPAMPLSADGSPFVPVSNLPHPPPGSACIPARPCAWCAAPVVIVRRPGRPRLYCRQVCRQRAFEHRHGFVHRRTVRPLPGQVSGDTWRGSGYERGGEALLGSKAHALRTSVRPEGRRRETLCGVLANPVAGQYFTPFAANACRSCAAVAAAQPLQWGISPSNELSRLRAIVDEAIEQRVDPWRTLEWLRATRRPAIPAGAPRAA